MPGHVFRKMTDDDLKAIFAYQPTQPPVKHRVEKPSLTCCPVCRTVHGGGEPNQKGPTRVAAAWVVGLGHSRGLARGFHHRPRVRYTAHLP